MALFHLFKPQVLSLLSSQSGSLVYGLSFFLSLSSFSALLHSENLRTGSLRYPLLSLFTLSQSIMVSFMTVMFPSNIVMKAVLTTAIAVASITGYAATTARDLTQFGTFLYSFSAAFLAYQLLRLLSLFGVIPFKIPWTETIGCSVGAALASSYLAHHTKMVFSQPGQKNEFGRKDHLVAALCLYNDVINLFVYVLRLLAEASNDRK